MPTPIDAHGSFANPGSNRPDPDAYPRVAPEFLAPSMPRRRILYVLTHLGFGGAETQVVDLATRMQGRGWEPMVLSLMHPSALTDRLEAAGIPCETLDAARGRLSPRLITGLTRVVGRFQPDVLHSHTLPANFTARAARALVDVPILVTSCHNVNEGGRARMLYYRLTDRLADLTTNVSHAAVERYVRIGAAPAGRIRYMPNGIDTDRFRPDEERRRAAQASLGISPDTFVWLAVGRLEAQKDYPNLLAAAARALDSSQRLLIVGDGGLRGDLEARIAAMGLGDRVQLLGLRPDVPDLMCAADAYVMSSAWEGLPIVLLEAAASGLPSVVTDVGGNRQIVDHGRTGMVVPSGDADALSDQMGRLCRMPAPDRRRMGLAARELVEETFGLEAIADQWSSIYDALLDARGRPSGADLDRLLPREQASQAARAVLG